MVGTVDRRSQALKATRKWRDDWMAEVDKQGDRVGDWAQQVDIKTFRCRWCNTVRLYNLLDKQNNKIHLDTIRYNLIQLDTQIQLSGGYAVFLCCNHN